MKTLIDRLKDRCRIEPATGCWVWRQAKCGGGHPMIEIAELGKSLNVRRLMYLIAVGQIAKGRVVSTSRTCGEKDCVNPEHLQSIRRADLNRQIAKERTYHGGNWKKTASTWHPELPSKTELPSKINGSGAGGTSKKRPRPVSPVTSVSAGDSSTGSQSSTAPTWPSVNDVSCGRLSEQGPGE